MFLASLNHVTEVWSSFSLNRMILIFFIYIHIYIYIYKEYIYPSENTYILYISFWERNRSIEVKSPLHRKMCIYMKQHAISSWFQAPWSPEVFPCTPDGEDMTFFFSIEDSNFNLKFMNSKWLWELENHPLPLLIPQRESFESSRFHRPSVNIDFNPAT